jgi:hypothetical protein
MKPSHIIPHVVAGIILIGGLCVLFSGLSLPVYTDPDAPAELSRSLENLPRDERFDQWYQKLPEHETAYKQLTDLGRGLIALALGISSATLFLRLVGKVSGKRAGWIIRTYWSLLWAIKIPLTVWYYGVRQVRFDYPVWGDSTAIGVFQDSIAWIVGFVVFSLALRILMTGYGFPKAILLSPPRGAWGWSRSIVLWLWLAVLILCVVPAIGDGDEGMVVSCTGAIPVILLALSGIAGKVEEKPAVPASEVHSALPFPPCDPQP